MIELELTEFFLLDDLARNIRGSKEATYLGSCSPVIVKIHHLYPEKFSAGERHTAGGNP